MSKKTAASNENGVCQRPSCPVSSLAVSSGGFSNLRWDLEACVTLSSPGSTVFLYKLSGKKELGANLRPHKSSM